MKATALLTMPTIAAIDRDSAALALIKDAFEAEGFDVLLYRTRERALNAFETKSPDIVITEVRLPEMDGIELLRRLRQRSSASVIFLSSRIDEADELIALQIGADDFIRKPFASPLLVERVKAILRRSRPPEPVKEQETSQNVPEVPGR